ncbi:pantoate--beta-alanine ligase [Pleionea sp. CnH1-48]|uniref:pantoate--beta-alanine ligase n=1 Tax=Pleionea sp. CnH1-48 TaxID=2954494 RepID=UPI0020981DE5|nr:pantoate--beta-alanine ligase [Pleionea sp. CnH1-48]MCO7227359.1 pantoate--beta-alanine ligase [Pleionea sp. CnH1-48]
MLIFNKTLELQNHIHQLKKAGKTIGFVPTMGNLHQGHLSLVKQAKQHADVVVTSIFVNPLQFGPNEDFDSYPRTEERDQELLKAESADVLFLPTVDLIYPQGQEVHTKVEVHSSLTNKLCGASRPTHFLGVTTIVNKLFNIVQPDVAIFGKKDYQQLMVIKRMASDLCLPINILGGDIVREDNGLAMSSRNQYLTTEQKDEASLLQKTLQSMKQALESGNQDFGAIENNARQQLEEHGFKVDYLTVCRQFDLEPASKEDKELVIAAAAWLGQPRLLDNLEVNLSS